MSRVDEIRERVDNVYFCGYSYVAQKDCSYLLGRVEKLERLLTRMLRWADENSGNFAEGSGPQTVWAMLAVARTLLADESKENEHGNK